MALDTSTWMTGSSVQLFIDGYPTTPEVKLNPISIDVYQKYVLSHRIDLDDGMHEIKIKIVNAYGNLNIKGLSLTPL